MNKKVLLSALMCMYGGCAAINAANVKVTMNAVSKTMTLVSATTGEAIDTGEPDGMIYSFDVPAGKYILSGFATDGKTLNGTIEMRVADTTELQEFKIITNTAYVTNDKNTWRVENGDYTFEVKVTSREGETQVITPGSSITAGRHTFLAFNGNSYYASFIPGASRKAEGYTTLYKSGTLTGNVNVSGVIPKGENYTVTVPEDAELQLNMKFAHFVDFTPVEPIEVTTEGGKRKLTYYLAQGQIYNYRTWIPGKLTRAGYFTMTADAAKRPVIEFSNDDYNMDPAAINHDPTANDGYETGGIFININERGHLSMSKGETFRLHSMRTWELTDNSTNNYFIEPDFHYTVIGLDGQPCDDLLEITSRPGSAWADIKAKGQGEAIVLVTYDAIGLNYYSNNEKKPYLGGEFWGAIWPENTAAFVVTVGTPGSAVKPNMTLNKNYNMNTLRLAGNNVDAEHDVFYYLDTEDGASYSFKPENVTEVTMAYPAIGERMATYTGFGHEGVTRNEDGSYTLLLRHGRQIVKLTDAAGNSVYQVLTAKECHREIINVKRPDSKIFQPGDEVKVQYSGLFHPANKIAGIYNMSAYVTYNGNPNGTSLILGSGQYTFGSAPSAQAVSINIPADHDVSTQPQIVMNEGVIQVNGYGDPIGNHRNIDDVAGRSPNFTAVPHKTYFGMIPDLVISLSETKEFSIKTVCNVDDADISISFNGKLLTPDAEGLYSGTYGLYEVTAAKKGYRCMRAVYNIDDNAEGIQIFDIALEEAPDAWDGQTKTEPEAVDGIYQVACGDELAWIADKVNSGTAIKAEIVKEIDLGNYDWTPIGNSAAKAFTGTMKGNGHTVRGLYINNKTAQYLGLFGYAKGSESSPASISGIIVDGSVSAKSYAGGILGYANAYVYIDRCANLAEVSGTSNNVGGIAGYVSATTSRITNCYNKGDITGTGNCGGIAGGHASAGINVENVFNLGEINCPKNAGACVGSTYAKTGLSNAFAVKNYDKTDNHTLVTDDQMKSGEIAYRLGNAFGQLIGQDNHPVFGGKEVLYDENNDKYYNEGVDTGTENIDIDTATPTMYYNLEGIPSVTPYEGMNIIHFSDGSVRKLIIR